MGASLAATVVHNSLPWVDVYRGLAILGVLVAHVGGRFLREVPQDSEYWWFIATFNRLLAFVVPAFLFLSTLLIGMSLLRSGPPYSWSRLRPVVVPYLVWTGIYLLFRFYEGTLPPLTPERISLYLLWGKSYFHLYYMVLAIQLVLLMPLLLPVLRRKVPAWAILLPSFGLTLAFYWANRLYWQIPFPGSTLIWYLPTLAVGLTLVHHMPRLEALMPRYRVWGLVFVGLGMALYLPLAYDAIRNIPVNTFQYQVGYWIYSSAASLVLVSLALGLARTPLSPALQLLGRYSLQIYLIHPLVIRLLERTPHFPEPLGVSPAFAIYVALSLSIPLAVAILARWLRASRLLFGRA
ncbi:acyltransferase [Meiothermus rufus]|uniref:acyltransferase n=1 Tax=Meiothermus rufus TaxID=604332 RepID=UPI0004807B74|nr:acyltransferase [Meiothermus rufus]